MYPLAVSLAMMFFFHEKKSLLVMLAVLMSLFGAALLSSGELEAKSCDTIVGLVAACISVFSYGGYLTVLSRECTMWPASTAVWPSPWSHSAFTWGHMGTKRPAQFCQYVRV